MSLFDSVTAKIITNPTVGKAALKLSANAPHIMVGVGVVGVVAAGVMACKQTMHAHHRHAQAISERTRIRAFVEKNPESDEAKTLKRDIFGSYVREARDMAVIYGPALSVAAVSLACIVGGHFKLNNRYIATTAALNTANSKLAAVEEKLVDEFGAEKASEVMQESAKEVISPDAYGRWYSRETTKNYGDTVEYNVFTVRMVQNYWNDILRSRGYVFLNEVYKDLGLAPTKAGQVVGWLYSGDERADGYIDFGLDTFYSDLSTVDYDQGIFINPNVDGPILNSKLFKDI